MSYGIYLIVNNQVSNVKASASSKFPVTVLNEYSVLKTYVFYQIYENFK